MHNTHFFSRLLAFCLTVVLLCGCTAAPAPAPVGTAYEPEPALENAPAELLTGGPTADKLVSIIFEGYADETILRGILDVLEAHQVPATFFVSGIMVEEIPDVVQEIAKKGFDIGNYGISGSRSMEENTPRQNIHQFEKAQALIFGNCLAVPTLACANGTEYTYEVLQAIAAAGLDAAVQADTYINHTSFQEKKDADNLIKTMVRGSILSVKLGQALSLQEFGENGMVWDEKPAIDPPPSIQHGAETPEEDPYENLIDTVTWLVEAFEEGGYSFVTPRQLSEAKIDPLGEPAELSPELLAAVDYARYPVPVTDALLPSQKEKAGSLSDLDGALFIGDSVTACLENYANRMRRDDPDFLKDTHFLTVGNASVEKLLDQPLFTLNEGEEPKTVQEASAVIGAKRIYLMLRFDNRRAYSSEKYMSNYCLLIARIREANPDAQIIIQSVLPAAAGHIGTPDNAQLFRLNLMLCKLCAAYGLPFADSAFALRDQNGDLSAEYCLDAATEGIHPNDAGCQAWLDFLCSHIPAL